MSTTRIQLKRADSMTSLNAVTLAKGEPAVYFDSSSGSGVLYIGDGVTSPGLEFATSGSSVTQHLIANTTTIGPAHTIVATHLGSVLTAIDTDDAKMQRLGFYDLGAVTPLSSGLNALGISDILHSGADNTGIRSRWHWMSTHVAPRRSIFYTGTSYTSVGDGTGSGGGNMEHTSVSNAATRIGYQVENLTYDYESVDGYTALTGTDGGVMALVAKKSGGNNVLQFKRLGSEDLTGDLTTHAITSVSHTGTASSIYHTAAASTSITALSYAAAANGSVLKKSSTGILHFAKLAFTDLTGVFRIGTDGVGSEAYTMRYDGTGVNGWESCHFVRTFKTATYAQSHISNSALGGRTPSLVIKDYDEDYLSSLEIMILKGTQADLNSFGANRIVFSAGKDASTTNKDMLFYTRLSRTSDVAPNFWMREDGSFWVNSSDDTRGTAYNYPKDITDMNRGIYVYPKKMGRISGSLSDYPGWAGLEIGSLTHTQAIASDPATTGINGIKIGHITSISTGSATVDSHHDLYFLNCGNLVTPASVTGIKLGALTSGTKSGADSHGVSITSLTSQGTGQSIGLNISTILSGDLHGDSFGVNLGTLTSGNSSYGINMASLKSELYSTGLNGEAIAGKSTTKGISFTLIDATGNFSELALAGQPYPTAIGFNASTISSTYHSVGLYLPDISATYKAVGLFLSLNSANKTIDDVIGNNVAIYTAGGDHYFGGYVKVTGDALFDGGVTVDEGHTLTVRGITDSTSLIVTNGDIRVTNGYFSGTHKGNYDDIPIGSTQSPTATTTLYTESAIQKLSFIKFTHPFNDARSVYRLGRGFNGQIITITFQYNGYSNANATIWKDSGDNSVYSDFEFKDGSYDLFDHSLVLTHEEAFSFVCEHMTTPAHPGTGWQTGTKYKWKLLQNM